MVPHRSVRFVINNAIGLVTEVKCDVIAENLVTNTDSVQWPLFSSDGKNKINDT
jgi:hypothetical protein